MRVVVGALLLVLLTWTVAVYCDGDSYNNQDTNSYYGSSGSGGKDEETTENKGEEENTGNKEEENTSNEGESTGKEPTCVLTDKDCTDLADMLNGTILTFPSSTGVCTITHVPKNTLPGQPPGPTINDEFPSVSPLFVAALYSVECSNGRFMNLYEYMVPDTTWPDDTTRTRAQIYTLSLHANGLDVAGVHFHWFGSRPFLIAVHHQSLSLTPRDFVTATINSLSTVGYLP